MYRQQEERDDVNMQVLHDRSTWTLPYSGSIFSAYIFLCLHQQRLRPVFLQLALTIDLHILLHTLA